MFSEVSVCLSTVGGGGRVFICHVPAQEEKKGEGYPDQT